MKVIIPIAKPMYHILLAILSNFISNGVLLFSLALSTALNIFPFCEYSPTAIIIPFPVPSIQWVPDNINGDGQSFLLFFLFCEISTHFSYVSFFIKSDSPVRALSSIFMPFPSINNISAQITSP